eukprot:UN31096
MMGEGGLMERLRLDLFRSLTEKHLGFFDSRETGDLTSRLTADTTKVGDTLILCLNVFLRNLITAFMVMAFTYIINARLALLTCVIVPSTVIISKTFGTYLKEFSKETQEKLADSNKVATECFGNMDTVRSFGAEWSEIARYTKTISAWHKEYR